MTNMNNEGYFPHKLKRLRNERKNIGRIIARETKKADELLEAGKALRAALIYGVWSDNPGSPGAIATTSRATDLGMMVTEIEPQGTATLAINLDAPLKREVSPFTKITSLTISANGEVLATESVIDGAHLDREEIPQSKTRIINLSPADLNQIKSSFIDADPSVKGKK